MAISTSTTILFPACRYSCVSLTTRLKVSRNPIRRRHSFGVTLEIFVHGCFWHGHEGCQYYVIPKTRTEFWLNKINTNIQNDMKNLISLKNMGWNVITIWECETKKKNNIKVLIDQIEKELYNNLMSNKNTSCKT